MDKQDIIHLEKILELFNEMYFKDLQGKDLTSKMITLKNFANVVNKLKEPKQVGSPKKKRPIKSGKKDATK